MSGLTVALAGLLAEAETAAVAGGLTPGGGAIMTVSLSAVVMLNVFCFYRVLTLPASDVQDLNAPLEIDTGDLDE
jgi:hypothetical protein